MPPAPQQMSPLAEPQPEISIDPEIASMLPALSSVEKRELEHSLISEGGRDPLIVWRSNGQLILLDGHNRYRACREYGIPFRVQPVDLESRKHALLLVETAQLGRRNLALDARAAIALSVLQRRSKLALHLRASAAGKAGGRGRPKTNSLSDGPAD